MSEGESEENEGQQLSHPLVRGFDVLKDEVNEEVVHRDKEHQYCRGSAHRICREQREVALIENKSVRPVYALILL